MKWVRFLMLAGGLLVLTVPAQANTALKYGIAPVPGAPVRIDACYGWLQDTEVGNVDYYLAEALEFTDTDQKTVSAVRFRFDFFTDFNELLGTRYGDLSGTFSSGVAIDKAHNHVGGYEPLFRAINIWNNVTTMVCSVDTVKFTDGSIWHSPVHAFTPN